jgi:hypothetical protein
MKKLLTLTLVLVTLALMEAEVMAQTRTIILNTGYDQWSNTKIALGQQDNEWRVMQSPPNNPPPPPPATGRPADVVSDNVWVSFNSALPTNFPNSRWISFAPNGGQGSSTVASYKYAFYFTLPVGVSSPQLTMKLSADDHITEVKLNNCSPLFTGSGGVFANNPPLMLSSALTCFNSGSNVNVLTVTVENTVAMSIGGLIVDGTVTYKDCKRLPIRDIPGLTSITLWESTFAAPTQHTFLKGGPELTTRLSGNLVATNRDFEGVPGGEFYDVFYSTWDGVPSATGQFVTIEAVWWVGAPSGGGLNIARVDFNGTGKFANSVASFVVLGNNAMPNDVGKAIDGITSTDTTMGNTIGERRRLRITVGFPCPCTPPPWGMVAWWPLDETQGAQLVHDLVGGHDGTPKTFGGAVTTIGASGGPMPVTGSYVGNSLLFGGPYVEVPDSQTLNFSTAPFTIDAWVKYYPLGQTRPIVSKFASPNGPGYFFSIEPDSAGVWKLTLRVNNVKYKGPAVPPDTWVFVAATRSSSGVRLYVGYNNTWASPVIVPGSPQNASSTGTPLWIGQWQLPGNVHPHSQIDEVEIFNRALTPLQIQSIFNAGSAGKCK